MATFESTSVHKMMHEYRRYLDELEQAAQEPVPPPPQETDQEPTQETDQETIDTLEIMLPLEARLSEHTKTTIRHLIALLRLETAQKDWDSLRIARLALYLHEITGMEPREFLPATLLTTPAKESSLEFKLKIDKIPNEELVPMALCYYLGITVQQDLARANTLFKKAEALSESELGYDFHTARYFRLKMKLDGFFLEEAQIKNSKVSLVLFCFRTIEAAKFFIQYFLIFLSVILAVVAPFFLLPARFLEYKRNDLHYDIEYLVGPGKIKTLLVGLTHIVALVVYLPLTVLLMPLLLCFFYWQIVNQDDDSPPLNPLLNRWPTLKKITRENAMYVFLKKIINKLPNTTAHKILLTLQANRKLRPEILAGRNTRVPHTIIGACSKILGKHKKGVLTDTGLTNMHMSASYGIAIQPGRNLSLRTQLKNAGRTKELACLSLYFERDGGLGPNHQSSRPRYEEKALGPKESEIEEQKLKRALQLWKHCRRAEEWSLHFHPADCLNGIDIVDGAVFKKLVNSLWDKKLSHFHAVLQHRLLEPENEQNNPGNNNEEYFRVLCALSYCLLHRWDEKFLPTLKSVLLFPSITFSTQEQRENTLNNIHVQQETPEQQQEQMRSAIEQAHTQLANQSIAVLAWQIRSDYSLPKQDRLRRINKLIALEEVWLFEDGLNKLKLARADLLKTTLEWLLFLTRSSTNTRMITAEIEENRWAIEAIKKLAKDPGNNGLDDEEKANWLTQIYTIKIAGLQVEDDARMAEKNRLQQNHFANPEAFSEESILSTIQSQAKALLKKYIALYLEMIDLGLMENTADEPSEESTNLATGETTREPNRLPVSKSQNLNNLLMSDHPDTAEVDRCFPPLKQAYQNIDPRGEFRSKITDLLPADACTGDKATLEIMREIAAKETSGKTQKRQTASEAEQRNTAKQRDTIANNPQSLFGAPLHYQPGGTEATTPDSLNLTGAALG